MKAKAAGTTTTRGNHRDLLTADPSTWRIRSGEIRCTCRHGVTWLFDFWPIMQVFGRCIVIFCGIRGVEWRWPFRYWGMSGRDLAVRKLGKALSGFVWLRNRKGSRVHPRRLGFSIDIPYLWSSARRYRSEASAKFGERESKFHK